MWHVPVVVHRLITFGDSAERRRCRNGLMKDNELITNQDQNGTNA